MQDDEALSELGTNLYALLQSIPICQLQELKCRKSLADLVIRIVNEVNKIELRHENDVLNESKEN